MATKDEAQQALLDAIEAVATKAKNTSSATVLQAQGESVARFADAWKALRV